MDIDTPETPLLARVAPGVYIGNVTAAMNSKLTTDMKITATIDLTGRQKYAVSAGATREFVLPSQELLRDEYQKMINKLKEIATCIKDFRAKNHNVLIYCIDGRNKSPLVAGYYMITYLGSKPTDVVTTLSTIYMTPEQRKMEQDDQNNRYMLPENITPEEREKLDTDRKARAELRCLTLITFKNLLRVVPSGGS